MKELLWPQPEHNGYRGYLFRLTLAIHRVYSANGNLFFSLYQCDDEKCLNSGLQHPITRRAWLVFMKTFVFTQLDSHSMAPN